MGKDSGGGNSGSGDVKSVAEPNGNTSTYFGGQGKADGPGHGHVVVDSDGKVKYARESADNGGETGWEGY